LRRSELPAQCPERGIAPYGASGAVHALQVEPTFRSSLYTCAAGA
jgi:hypothetical protein